VEETTEQREQRVRERLGQQIGDTLVDTLVADGGGYSANIRLYYNEDGELNAMPRPQEEPPER
jgi:hypothetical protein